MEKQHSINGVPGILFRVPAARTQTWRASRPVKGMGDIAKMTVHIRFDDSLRNGHATFAITCDLYDQRGRDIGGGAAHDDIAHVFPELAPLTKWHLVSTEGPMHYPGNVTYHASDRDHDGLRAGETRQVRNGRTGELCWILKGPATRYHEGPTPPDETFTVSWEPLMRIGEGKAREFDNARRCAVWPGATDETLMRDDLAELLVTRLPALIAEFRADMDACGLEWGYGEPTCTGDDHHWTFKLDRQGNRSDSRCKLCGTPKPVKA